MLDVISIEYFLFANGKRNMIALNSHIYRAYIPTSNANLVAFLHIVHRTVLQSYYYYDVSQNQIRYNPN